MDKINVIILSCANFSDMWPNITFLYKKYWPEGYDNMHIITDGLALNGIPNPFNLIVIHEDMSDRLINFLKSCTTDYVFLSFDDYYLKKSINHNDIVSLVNEMKKEKIDYCRLFSKPYVMSKKMGIHRLKKLPLKKVYEVNFYPCIWKKDSLLSVLKPHEDIWKTEARLTRRAHEKQLECVYISGNKFFPFVDVVRKGKYLRSSYRYLKRNKLFISDRKKRSLRETITLFFQSIASKLLPKSLKNIVKKILRKKGFTFFSDYANSED